MKNIAHLVNICTYIAHLVNIGAYIAKYIPVYPPEATGQKENIPHCHSEKYLILKVVSGEKEGGQKYTQSTATTVGPWRWAFFPLRIQPPSCCEQISISGDSCTIGRHFDMKGRHGGQNCFERLQLLLMPPVETALKTFDRR